MPASLRTRKMSSGQFTGSVIPRSLSCDAHRRRAERSRQPLASMNCRCADVVISAMAKPPPPDDARRFIPPDPTLSELREAAESCTGCLLYRNATQTVFGAGPAKARLMLVGEQPGDVEDLEGLPFVGPAGRLLDRALAEAGIDRAQVYVTNAVKHFKWVQRGKRRLHSKPGAREIHACYPCLQAEIATLKPQIIVCLGATAAQALLGRSFRVSQRRGEFIASPLAPHVMATIHPSSLLRAPDPDTRAREFTRFIAELRTVAERLGCGGAFTVNQHLADLQESRIIIVRSVSRFEPRKCQTTRPLLTI